MSNLERRYRVLLKVLPEWYRQDREEEMVGLFLAGRTDDLDREHGWPGWGEAFAMLGLGVRTHLAAGVAATRMPVTAVWRGEVVRALGVLGLLLGTLYAGTSITIIVRAYGDPDVTGPPTWVRLLELAPIVAFVALLNGRRTLAKIAAAVAVVPAGIILGQVHPTFVWMWVLFQLPTLVTFVCLCLGFHWEAPTPPARRLAWWGGGALLLGLGGGVVLGGAGFAAAALALTIARAVAYVRRDVVLGRALSLFAVLLLAPVAVLIVGAVVVVPVMLVVAALLVVSAAAPVRRASVLGSRLP